MQGEDPILLRTSKSIAWQHGTVPDVSDQGSASMIHAPIVKATSRSLPPWNFLERDSAVRVPQIDQASLLRQVPPHPCRLLQLKRLGISRSSLHMKRLATRWRCSGWDSKHLVDVLASQNLEARQVELLGRSVQAGLSEDPGMPKIAGQQLGFSV